MCSSNAKPRVVATESRWSLIILYKIKAQRWDTLGRESGCSLWNDSHDSSFWCYSPSNEETFATWKTALLLPSGRRLSVSQVAKRLRVNSVAGKLMSSGLVSALSIRIKFWTWHFFNFSRMSSDLWKFRMFLVLLGALSLKDSIFMDGNSAIVSHWVTTKHQH